MRHFKLENIVNVFYHTVGFIQKQRFLNEDNDC